MSMKKHEQVTNSIDHPFCHERNATGMHELTASNFKQLLTSGANTSNAQKSDECLHAPPKSPQFNLHEKAERYDRMQNCCITNQAASTCARYDISLARQRANKQLYHHGCWSETSRSLLYTRLVMYWNSGNNHPSYSPNILKTSRTRYSSEFKKELKQKLV